LIRIFRSSSYIKEIRVKVTGAKSVESHPAPYSVTDMEQSHCNRSDDKSISDMSRLMILLPND